MTQDSSTGTLGPRSPAVSVIICVRNGERTLGVQLEALAGQLGDVPFEVIIVDNGSTDATRAIAQAWIDAGTRAASSARVIDASDRVGICHARNSGAEAARADVLAFCDADDVVAAEWVAEAFGGLATGASAVTGRVYELEPDGTLWRKVVLDKPGEVRGAGGTVPFAWGCSFAVTRRDFVEAGGFDESLPPYGCDDIEFGLRLAHSGRNLVYQPRMAVSYREAIGVRSAARKQYRSGIAQACVWARHPAVYGPLPRLIRQVGTLVGDFGRSLFGRGGRPGERVRTSAVGLAHNLGTIVGMRRWVLSGRLGEPQLYRGDGA